MAIKLVVFIALFIAAASAQLDMSGVTGSLPDTSGITGGLPIPAGGSGEGGNGGSGSGGSAGAGEEAAGRFNRFNNRFGAKNSNKKN